MAKSKITKGINRKIQTKTFEQVDIICQIEEEITWENIEEREKKTKKITDMLVDDFKNTYNKVVETLGVDRCIGSVSVNKNLNSQPTELPKEKNKQEDNELDLDFN